MKTKKNFILQKTLKLDELRGKSIDEIIKIVVDSQSVLNIQLPDGSSVKIESKPKLRPLKVFEGFVPEGWKEEIYNEI